MPALPDTLLPGRPDPLGATWDGLGVNFAVFSAHAEAIDLCLFQTSGRREIARYRLPECTDEIWHGYLPEALPGCVYGYRAHGRYAPRSGHRFNPNKLLLDPYARALVRDLHWTDALYGYRIGATRGDLSFDRRDSAAAMPKAVVTTDRFDWGDDRRPDIPWSDTVIYEAHVRGLTMRRDDLLPPNRGTFAALGDARVIDHLRRLGVTAVELMPVQAYAQDRFLVEAGLTNYWGYSTLAFFAPEPRYLGPGGADSLRIAVRRLHAAGIEVILDVVYNHTCEGSEQGPTLSWRGLDNASYYRLVPGDERHLINDTGCGNTLNLSHPRVLQMVMDSLRYWATSFRVDGFRFDLGTTLGREGPGFDPGSGFFDAIRQDPVLSRLKLIAEPWDVGPGGYHLGDFPPGFAEWNDRFRDTTRRFWRGDAGQRAELSARLSGSADLFGRRRRRPWSSINFVAAHDGFTLHDVVSYAHRHNEANGEDNADGHGDNCSSNWGLEGPSHEPAVNALRERVKRAMLAILLLSHGTPMLRAGDEMGGTQQGNNNAYCQDNEISWIDWRRAETGPARQLGAFVARLIALRRSRPILHSARFLHGKSEPTPGILDIAWFDEDGRRLSEEAWNDPEGRRLVLRRAGTAADPGQGVDVVLLLINGSEHDHAFVLPPPPLGWHLLLDTARPERDPTTMRGATTMVASRSVTVLGATVPPPVVPASAGRPA
ncbi:MAG: glycogen debranching protein GlgX [Rhodospirillales bacterium]|nr:glycogen debranching protein GlgX [Rhodospirillales bacterium]